MGEVIGTIATSETYNQNVLHIRLVVRNHPMLALLMGVDRSWRRIARQLALRSAARELHEPEDEIIMVYVS